MNIYFVSLGCDKNLVDTEKMLGALTSHGYSFTGDVEAADIAVVNTCCFIKDAQTESVEAILEMADRKKSGLLKGLIVAGCLAQRYRDDIEKEVPEVDVVLGTTAIDRIVEAADDILRKQGHEILTESLDKPATGGEARVLTTGGHYGYLRIAEGCNKWCTYCVIPSVRGPYRSVPMEQVLAEAKELAERGVKELILVAQETTLYGTDLYGEKRLPALLRGLAAIDGIRWIRLLYCYPEEITDELIDTIAAEPKVLHYLDMPIQHASDEVLRRMGRHTTRKDLEEVIGKIRAKIPDCCLRTTLITGFPGETETDHRHLLAFVRKMKFDRLGVFPYSREDGTPAAKMKPQIKAAVKRQRRKELMLAQQEIAFRKARKQKNRILDAIVEGRIAEDQVMDVSRPGAFVYTARTYMDAPDVDGMLFLETSRDLMTGDFVSVRITGSRGYDLIGELVDTRDSGEA